MCTVFKFSVPSFSLVQFRMISFRPCTKLRNKSEIKDFLWHSFPLPVSSFFPISSSFLAHFEPILYWYAKRIFTNYSLISFFALLCLNWNALCNKRYLRKIEDETEKLSYITEPKKTIFVILTHLLKDINTQTMIINFVIHCKIPSQSKILLKLYTTHFIHPNPSHIAWSMCFRLSALALTSIGIIIIII